MQTFLPKADLIDNFKCLDNRRLGKQRVEAYQIAKALTIPSYGWQSHPATKMWRGHVEGLLLYTFFCCQEWRKRGYQDTITSFLFGEFGSLFNPIYHNANTVIEPGGWEKLVVLNIFPNWFGGPIHASHRAALLSKDREHYKQFGWTERPEQNYFWPQGKEKISERLAG